MIDTPIRAANTKWTTSSNCFPTSCIAAIVLFEHREMIRLSCPVQFYAWGKFGSQSEVANLYFVDSEAEPEESQTYGELWMGTHVKGPSRMHGTDKTLSSWLAAHPNTLGKKLKQILLESSPSHDEIHLPFLFKVLSINKALSLQVHPTKNQAQNLHICDPSSYPDPNHKPEMAIALTPFELLCGFRPMADIVGAIKGTPELFELIDGSAFQKLMKAESETDGDSEAARAALRLCFSSLMRQPAPLVSRNVTALTDRVALALNRKQATDAEYIRGELLIRLNYNYPGDVGVIASLFLNHFLLKPGEATFLGPNEPHAYLYGDCVECMACSDNTIRAGLSPKPKDIAVLCESLTYRMAGVEDNKLDGVSDPLDPALTIYDPPVPEFTVHRIQMSEGQRSYDLRPLSTCSILLMISGDGKFRSADRAGPCRRGHVFFVPADVPVQFSDFDSPMLAFRAFCGESL